VSSERPPHQYHYTKVAVFGYSHDSSRISVLHVVVPSMQSAYDRRNIGGGRSLKPVTLDQLADKCSENDALLKHSEVLKCCLQVKFYLLKVQYMIFQQVLADHIVGLQPHALIQARQFQQPSRHKHRQNFQIKDHVFSAASHMKQKYNLVV